MVKSIAHIGIAVKDMKSSTELFRKLLGRDPDHGETVSDQKVATTMFQLGETALELTAATDQASPIARFINSMAKECIMCLWSWTTCPRSFSGSRDLVSSLSMRNPAWVLMNTLSHFCTRNPQTAC